MRPVRAPDVLELTNNWHEIQYTNLHQYHPHSSQEYNKLLKSMARGSYFVVNGFRLGLFSAIVDGGYEACIARLTPGILVHDWTVIDFVQPMKSFRKYIYIKLFDERDRPAPKLVYKLGSRYYHGMYGDGIDAIPTYDILQCIPSTDDRTNFRTMYSLSLNDLYGQDGSVIDIENIEVEDFRYPPNDVDPTDPIDPWYPSADKYILLNPDPQNDPDSPVSGEEEEEEPDDYDYTTLIARSQSLMWSMVVDGY